MCWYLERSLACNGSPTNAFCPCVRLAPFLSADGKCSALKVAVDWQRDPLIRIPLQSPHSWDSQRLSTLRKTFPFLWKKGKGQESCQLPWRFHVKDGRSVCLQDQNCSLVFLKIITTHNETCFFPSLPHNSTGRLWSVLSLEPKASHMR